MVSYTTALLYAIPAFVFLVLIEILYGHLIKDQKYGVMDTISSLSSGITNVVKSSLGIGLGLVSYPYLLDKFALMQIETTWLLWLLGFVTIDFAGYWTHRINHKVNFFWNEHVVHHSSEHFNLACALRQSISNLIGFFAFLMIPAAILGVPNQVIAVLAPLHLFAQFWYHTEHIGKLGWLEYVIITPSQHRVHHAINPEYIDKNLGQIFSFWDRIFGTFQEELDDVPAQYGVLKPAETWNPILINFQHLWRLIKDAWRTKNYWDKIRIWFMPTGWRPEDVKEKYPIEIIKDVYGFDRYKTSSSTFFKAYSIFQLLIVTGLMLFMFYNFENIGYNGLLLCGAFLFLSVYGYTSLMDQKKYAFWIEILRGLIGLAILYVSGDWFGINNYLVVGSNLVLLYLIITIIGGLYFGRIEPKKHDMKLSV